MKKIFVAMLALAAATACSNDELVSVNQEAIGFDNAFVDNATRSVYDKTKTTDNIALVDVFGFVENVPLFGGDYNRVLIKKENNWSYENTQYWIPGAHYNFIAISPNNSKFVGNVTAEGANLPNFKLGDGTFDYLYAQTGTIEGKESGNEKVAFTFRHILSKVKFTFVNKYLADNTTIQVRDIKILNAYETAGVELNETTTTWSNQDGSKTLKFGGATEKDNNANQVLQHNDAVESYMALFIIPGAIEGGYNIEFTYDILVGGVVIKSFTKTVNISNFAPVAGLAYNLKAEIKPGQPIEFTVTNVIDWDEDHDGKENTAEGDTDGDNQVDTVIP